MFILKLLNANLCLRLALGLHFYGGPGDIKCFYENLAEGSLLMGDFQTFVTLNGKVEPECTADILIYVEETFNNDYRVYHQLSRQSDFLFTALEKGEHRICVEPRFESVKETQEIRFRVEIRLQTGILEVEEYKALESVSSIKQKVYHLSSQLEKLRNEQRAIIEEERVSNHQTVLQRQNILMWCMFEFTILLAVFVIQLRLYRSVLCNN